MVTVYFDGNCGLCSREIRHYKRIAPQGVFDWCDITRNPARLSEISASFEDAMRVLHARDHFGRVHKGVDAFVLIWRYIPAWHVAASLVSATPVKQLARPLHRAFAAWRFERMSVCGIPSPHSTHSAPAREGVPPQ